MFIRINILNLDKIVIICLIYLLFRLLLKSEEKIGVVFFVLSCLRLFCFDLNIIIVIFYSMFYMLEINENRVNRNVLKLK